MSLTKEKIEQIPEFSREDFLPTPEQVIQHAHWAIVAVAMIVTGKPIL